MHGLSSLTAVRRTLCETCGARAQYLIEEFPHERPLHVDKSSTLFIEFEVLTELSMKCLCVSPCIHERVD